MPNKKIFKLALASSNQHKIKEISEIFNLYENLANFTPDFIIQPNDIEIEETGQTFIDNSNIKASQLAQILNETSLADDSGLEVEALDNRPGIYSNRYASGSDKVKRDKLLAELDNIPQAKRKARYVCSMSVAKSDGAIIFNTQAYLNGWIGFKDKGSHGIGYDPIFYPIDSNKSVAELSDQEKNLISHRSLALKKVIIFLNNYLKTLTY